MLDLGFLEDVERILVADPLQPADGAVLGDDAARDPPARRPVPVRPGHDQGQDGDAHGRHRRAVRARGRGRATRPTRSSRCSRPSGPSRRSCSCGPRSAATSSTARCATAGMNVKALHGDMTQGARDGVMISFKDGRLPLLVATDVAARGLDISGISHVINYDVPTSPDVYVHRIGRTGPGRAQRTRDHVLRAPPAPRDPGDRDATPGSSSRPGSRTPTSRRPRIKAPPRRHSKPRVSANGDGQAYEADRRRRAAPPGSSRRTSSTRSPRPPASTASPSATSACSSASRSSRCPSVRRNAILQRSTAPRSTGNRCVSRPPGRSAQDAPCRRATPAALPCLQVGQGPSLSA